MEKLTREQIEKMTDSELAQEAARLMGWRKDNFGEWRYQDKDNPKAWPTRYDFDPANDLCHAAELCGAFLAAWPDWSFISCTVKADGWRATLLDYRGSQYEVRHASEARARTVAIVLAWNELSNAK